MKEVPRKIQDYDLKLLSKDSECGDAKACRKSVTLEEALEIIGFGWYQWRITLTTGLALFASLLSIIVMSYVVPAMSCSMQLNQVEKGVLTSMTFVGMVFSSQLSGYLGDRIGRRGISLPCLVLSGCFSLLASLAPNLIILQIIWFANGLMVAGIVTPILVYAAEFTTVAHRAQVLLVASAISSLATTYQPCIAWIILPLDVGVVSWRLLLGMGIFPPLLAAALLAKLPESPKYLLCSGQTSDAINVLKIAYSSNNPTGIFQINQVELDEGDEVRKEENFFLSIWKQTVILFKPPLFFYMAISCTLTFCLFGPYNLVALWFPELLNMMTKSNNNESVLTVCKVISSGDTIPQEQTVSSNCKLEIDSLVYIANVCIGILQFVAFCATSSLTDIIGRKLLMMIYLLISTVSTLLIILIPSFWLTISSFGAIIILGGAAIPILMSIVVDFFPTHIRSMATCLCMIFGRTGAAGGSQIFGYFMETHCEAAFYTILVFFALVAVICFWLKVRRK